MPSGHQGRKELKIIKTNRICGHLRGQIKILFFCCLSLTFFLISCSSKPGQPLTGKWQEVNGKELIEFLADGTFRGTLIWDLQKTTVQASGHYKVGGDIADLSVDKPENLAPMTLKLTFSSPGDELTIFFQQGGALKRDGTTSLYRRIR